MTERTIDTIIIHCAATKPSHHITVEDIRRWHTDPKPKGRGWNDIGYHKFIDRLGKSHRGRPDKTAGAHAYGHNDTSLGICLAGGIDEAGKPASNFNTAQWKALEVEVRNYLAMYPGITRIIGHNDVSSKDCPCFDVNAWAELLMEKHNG